MYCLNICWRQFPIPNLQQDSYDDPNHMAQKAVCNDLEMEMMLLLTELGQKYPTDRGTTQPGWATPDLDCARPAPESFASCPGPRARDCDSDKDTGQ